MNDTRCSETMCTADYWRCRFKAVRAAMIARETEYNRLRKEHEKNLQRLEALKQRLNQGG